MASLKRNEHSEQATVCRSELTSQSKPTLVLNQELLCWWCHGLCSQLQHQCVMMKTCSIERSSHCCPIASTLASSHRWARAYATGLQSLSVSSACTPMLCSSLSMLSVWSGIQFLNATVTVQFIMGSSLHQPQT